MLITNIHGGTGRVTNYHKTLQKDMIQTIFHEEPKLRVHVKVIEFRESVLVSVQHAKIIKAASI